jgi:hypothetical protein
MRALSGVFPRDITAMKGCPNARQTMASPVPVLPLVSSMTVCPGRSRPCALASRIISSAMRSFLDPPGLKYSSFIKRRPSSPSRRRIWCNSTMGVPPMTSVMEWASGGAGGFIRLD